MTITDIQKTNNRVDVWSSNFYGVEFADDTKRAIVTIPIIHVGSNKKGLFWTAEMAKKVAPEFKSVTLRYDLDGKEGSSHTPTKLSSPHFDVGWTTDAWYDEKTKAVWVKGEVTHPAVIEKLQRLTSDGKREINFASMGVYVDKSICSICGHEFGMEGCDHIRNEKYGDEVCYSVPTEITKALHVALTNDPADGEAEIKDVIFQELSAIEKRASYDKDALKTVNRDKAMVINSSQPTPKGDDFRMTQNKLENGANAVKNTQNATNDRTVSDALANNSMGNTTDAAMKLGEVPSSEEILRQLAERIKTLEMAMNMQQAAQSMATSPEVVNQTQNAGATQDNMGTTQQFENPKEGANMETKDAQYSNQKAPENPSDKKLKAEMQDDMPAQGGDKLDQILALLQKLVGGQLATQDASELIGTGKEKAKEPEVVMEHKGPGETVGAAQADDESNKKNKQHMMEPGKVATADDSVDSLKLELADMKKQMETMKKSLELADNDVPEFGGVKSTQVKGADARFGSFNSWAKIDASKLGI
jgi:hypothetical protein